MKNNTGLRIETLVSLIVNIILGALIFTWACANMPAAAATVIGIAVVALGIAFSVSFPKLMGDR